MTLNELMQTEWTRTLGYALLVCFFITIISKIIIGKAKKKKLHSIYSIFIGVLFFIIICYIWIYNSILEKNSNNLYNLLKNINILFIILVLALLLITIVIIILEVYSQDYSINIKIIKAIKENKDNIKAINELLQNQNSINNNTTQEINEDDDEYKEV